MKIYKCLLNFLPQAVGASHGLPFFRYIGGVLPANQSKNNNQKTYDKYNYKNILFEKPISPIQHKNSPYIII